MEPLLLLPKIKGYETIAFLSIDEVLPVLHEAKQLLEFGFYVTKHRFRGLEDYPVSLNSERLLTYTKGLTCALCNTGYITHFAIQRNNNPGQHLNAYGRDLNGRYVQFTSDHKIPKSRGGHDDLANRQPTCATCNFKKGDRLHDEQYSPNQIKIMQKQQKEIEERNLRRFKFYETDDRQICSAKTAAIYEFKKLEQECAGLTGEVGKVLLTIRLPKFVSIIINSDIARLKDHPEWDWKLTYKQLQEVVKAIQLTRQCLPEMIQLGAARFSRFQE